ncbi:CpsB/CapC family capsule biosynthesis tyrosine phosphatase [Bacillus sp. UNCCL81]|uniref:tyrosine-protein phosphatase n=1 Tax=Bacillus sp. UNCCL81 TaxID=1502755 RepID=UPI0008EE9792|nr:CpsB/CapC family capsule biosynthesis tyrosine phosphatase [Bacillus sp. UNCCL81]SFD09842.1 protein-tyrosine phosphatase [Bacillus sp. UNCCL81]
MIDLHCHILPGLDDGPITMEDSINMARAAVDNGIHTIVASPHHQNGRYNTDRKTILEKVEELNLVLKQKDIPLTILPGQEVRLYGELIQDFELNQIVSINDGRRYVLCELPSSHIPHFANRLFYEMQANRITPILVHPERNKVLINEPYILFDLVQKGILTQLTASSITGNFGKKIQKFAFKCIEANWVHTIASDAHNTKNRNFELIEAYEIIREKFGIDTEFQMRENAQSIVNGDILYPEEPLKLKQNIFVRLLGI